MVVNYGAIITSVLTYVLPFVAAAVIAWVGREYAALVVSNKNSHVFQLLNEIAVKVVTAAYQLGQSNGWTPEACKTYAEEHLLSYAKSLKLPLTDDELAQVIDSLVEAAYADLKFSDWSPVGTTAKKPPVRKTAVKKPVKKPVAAATK